MSDCQPPNEELQSTLPGYTIRLARREDLDRLEPLLLALQDHLEAANPDLWQMKEETRQGIRTQIANRLQANGSLTLVADHEADGVVGVINGRVVSNTRYVPRRAGTIDQAFVRPDHRRRGVGTALVTAICRFFAAEKVDDLSLRYVVGNEEASAFWQALGFEPRIITAGAPRGRVEQRLPGTWTQHDR